MLFPDVGLAESISWHEGIRLFFRNALVIFGHGNFGTFSCRENYQQINRPKRHDLKHDLVMTAIRCDSTTNEKQKSPPPASASSCAFNVLQVPVRTELE